ncbi:MAG: hypothetical protein WED00_00125 [Aquisalimonadaceae bacterium]
MTESKRKTIRLRKEANNGTDEEATSTISPGSFSTQGRASTPETSNPDPSRSAGTPLSTSDSAPALRGRLRDDDIEAKTGDYLLSFGYPGSGKTTFQSFLSYYVTHVGSFQARPLIDPEDSALGWEPMATYNDWIKLWRDGRFPPPNPMDDSDIRELTFEVKPKEGVKTPLTFSFLEVSGELMREVMADRDRDPGLTDTVRRYLANESIRMILVLIVDPEHDQRGENDLLFQNLFTFLDVNFPGFRERASLALLISKPDTALYMLKREKPGFRHYAELRGDLCEDYIETFLPATYNVLDSWPNQGRVQIMTLHLGEVVQEGGEPRIVKHDHRDIEKIFSWIYTQFTGARLGPKWWQKALQWIRE